MLEDLKREPKQLSALYVSYEKAMLSSPYFRLICDDCDKHCHAFVPSTSTTEDPDIFCTPFCKGDGDFAMGCCLDRFCKCWQGVVST